MLIPLGTDRALRRPSVVTPALVLLNVGAFVAMLLLDRSDPDLHERVLGQLAVVGGEGFAWWQPLTSTLLHGGPLHLAGNMLFLWVFGQPVEDRYGRGGFLGLYLLGAVAAGGLHAALAGQWVWLGGVTEPGVFLSGGADERVWVPVAAIGASGAIAAVSGAFLVLYPRTYIRCFFIFFLTIVRVPAWWFVGLAIAWSLLAEGMGIRGGVAHLAHLGGYALGISLSMLLLWARVFPREPYDLFTIFRQAHRRRQLRSAGAVRPLPERAAAARPSPQTRLSEEVSLRRAEVSTLLAQGRVGDAAERYLALASEFAHVPGAAVMSRRVQYDLAAHFVQEGRAREAAEAYGRFLGAYPDDRESGVIRVLLARLLAGLGEAEQARALLLEVGASGSPQDRLLATQEMDTIARTAGQNGAVR